MREAAFRINPDLDPEALAAEYQAAGRIHIPDFLERTCAERLLAFLQGSEAWKLVFNHQDKLFELDRSTQAGLTALQREQFDLGVYAAARTGFQFRYETLRAPDEDSERSADPNLLNRFARFLSSEPALSFLRTVTGAGDVTFADAQATAYGPGHFLTTHDDDVTGKNRRAAYVFNLSKAWRAEWGGLLTFHEAGSGRAEAYVPSFNALNLLAVPQPHCVGLVAPFAGGRRYSVTGWLRAGPKP
jgi:Rps23 Pro-64 3,4-dihydroxylase Tpa1-like proline 4-hydroxylase